MKTYSDKLKDPRWLARREIILVQSDHCCTQCEKTEDDILSEQGKKLEVHHVAYMRGREPWDYPDDLLIPLCNSCHFNRQVFDEEAIFEFARMLRHMDMWHVHTLKKRLRLELDGGWKPAQYDAYLELTKGRR